MLTRRASSVLIVTLQDRATLGLPATYFHLHRRIEQCQLECLHLLPNELCSTSLQCRCRCLMSFTSTQICTSYRVEFIHQISTICTGSPCMHDSRASVRPAAPKQLAQLCSCSEAHYLTGPLGTASEANSPEAAGDMPGDRSGLGDTAAALAAAETGLPEAGLPGLLATAGGGAASTGGTSICQLAFAVGTVSSGTCRCSCVTEARVGTHKLQSVKNSGSTAAWQMNRLGGHQATANLVNQTH